MPASTMVREKQRVSKAKKNGRSTEEAKPGRRRNPLNHPLSSDFLSKPHSLDFTEGLQSDEFAMEKCAKVILEPLEFESEKEWLSFAKQVWAWVEQEDVRRKEAVAEEIVATLNDDDELLNIFKKKLVALEA